jgi:hypothetical protein
MLRQEPSEITKSGGRDVGIAKGQHCAGGGIQHPRRHHNTGAVFALDENDVSPTTLLRIK